MLSVSDSDAEDPGSPPGGGKIVIVYHICIVIPAPTHVAVNGSIF